MPELLPKKEEKDSNVPTFNFQSKIRRSIDKGDSNRTVRGQEITQIALNPIKIYSEIRCDFTARPSRPQAPCIATRKDLPIGLNRANILLDRNDFIVRKFERGECGARAIGSAAVLNEQGSEVSPMCFP